MTIDILKSITIESKCVNTVPVRQSVRRSLFGKVDHDESMEFLRKELDAIADSHKKRWNFDFKEETPLEPCNYEWTPVKSDDVIPRPYALSRLPYLYEHTENTISCHQPKESATRTNSQVTTLRQTSLDGYIRKTKKRTIKSTNQSKSAEPTMKKLCITPTKTEN